ncbi:hypothetical protein BVL40_06310 [Corynebacterium diphtheriae]|nr:hypothetical protein BVL37_06955 [Corynebacterium diphtheriae]QOE67620.1 hypothetical protein FGA20_04035 [Corynebacterium diphtheriae bv. mitis]OMO48267.1 hypothetical protein BVL40_06310 [Corynebacterium diphtheriae]ONF67246.1 hypothetical protein BXA20_05985 [Corynebacterium diphtheriae]OSQ08425.1 hypothetical protein B1A61_01300 [Corynebacterium diphtheriae]
MRFRSQPQHPHKRQCLGDHTHILSLVIHIIILTLENRKIMGASIRELCHLSAIKQHDFRLSDL